MSNDLTNFWKSYRLLMGRVRFDEEEHKYNDTDVKYISVTTFVSSLFPKFDAERIAGYVAKKRGVSKKEILDEWENLATIGKEVGHELHSYIENFLNYRNFIPLVEEHLLDAFHAWEEKNIFPNGDLLPIATELIVKSVRYPLAGTIDLLAVDIKTGEFIIVDWKSNKKDLGTTFTKKTAVDGIDGIPDSNYGKYNIQVNLYKLILAEIYPEGKYGTPRIVWLGSPDGLPREYYASDITDSLHNVLEETFI